MPTVQAIATGGTIACTSGPDGNVPTESIHEFARAHPQLFDDVSVELDQLAQTPSSELSLEELESLADRIRAVADGVDGIVVFHGTDTIEETAYYLDLVCDVDVPVVLTGAQRAHDQVSPDGPANVRGALDAASHEHIRDGVYVFFNEYLHAARTVTKSHSTNPNAYDSGKYGPVAELTPDGFWFYRRPESLSRTIPARELNASVTVVSTSTDTDGDAVRDAVDRGVDGLVVDALGSGNVPGDVAVAVEDAIVSGVPVVITTRCRSGSVSDVYGSDGGGKTLMELGAVFAPNLPAHKARIKLLVALSTTDDCDAIDALFDLTSVGGHGFTPTERDT